MNLKIICLHLISLTNDIFIFNFFINRSSFNFFINTIKHFSEYDDVNLSELKNRNKNKNIRRDDKNEDNWRKARRGKEVRHSSYRILHNDNFLLLL